MGESFRWFPSAGKSFKQKATTHRRIVCRALRMLSRKRCGRSFVNLVMKIRVFQKAGASRSSGEGRISSSVKKSLVSKPSCAAADNSKQTKVFDRASSWSHYLDNAGSNDDAVDALSLPKYYVTELSDLFIGQRFATGSHSRLYHGYYKKQAVAVKLIMPSSEDEVLSSQLDHQFSHEVGLLSRLHHRNIVKFVSACKRPPVFCVITEYLSGGSLKGFLHKTEPYSLSAKKVTSIALDIARGMEYLHSQGVIHRDLKSDNIIMTEDLCVKVADFGVSCLESHQCSSMKAYAGTYRWMAPEMIKEKPCTRKVDVYSFGIVLWELLTGLTPYEGMTPVQAAFAVCQKNARPPVPPHCPRDVGKLMRKCWSTHPSSRPEFSDIVKVLEDLETKSL